MSTGTNQYDVAFSRVQATIKAYGKAMKQLQKRMKILHRDWIRAQRRSTLIHNGRKPR